MRRKTYRVRPSHIKRSMGERILFSIVFIIFTIMALSYVFSFAWVFLNSLKDGFEFAVGEALDMPEKLLWSNYIQAFREFNVEGSTFLDMWWNTIWLAVGRTFLTLLSTSMCAYAYARYEFRFRKLLYVFSVIMMTLQMRQLSLLQQVPIKSRMRPDWILCRKMWRFLSLLSRRLQNEALRAFFLWCQIRWIF